MSYATYVVGADSLISPMIVDNLKRSFADATFLRRLQGYRSNWRVLHIDGFEHSPLPAHRGKMIQFGWRYGTTTTGMPEVRQSDSDNTSGPVPSGQTYAFRWPNE
jgi:hypothetical protein